MAGNRLRWTRRRAALKSMPSQPFSDSASLRDFIFCHSNLPGNRWAFSKSPTRTTRERGREREKRERGGGGKTLAFRSFFSSFPASSFHILCTCNLFERLVLLCCRGVYQWRTITCISKTEKSGPRIPTPPTPPPVAAVSATTTEQQQQQLLLV